MFKRILLSVFCLSLFCAASAKTMTRKDFVQPVEQGKLLLVPTFVSCSVYYGSPELENVRLEFRPKGSKQPWRQALTPLYYPEFNNYRGSIVRLEEDTKYEIRFLSGGKEVCRGDVRTWKSDVPVARTVYITPEMMKNPPIKISDKGDRKGWVRYTVKPGTVLENNTDKLSILFDGAGYVLLDDVVLKAGHFRHAVEIHNSGFIRIRNCDISRWGRVGKQRFDKGGKFFEDVSTTRFGWKDGGKLPYVNFNAAIRLQRCSDVVIERCYIHDPRNHANSWRYSHPQGPCGILMDCVRYSTVIRYCDIVGSDGHWFNDCVEGIGNFEENGGFRRDADIYGNFMYFSADDNIELDGGQQNVRCFDNRFQASFCGVSIQGCAVGPSYVFGNLFFGMGDEFGECGQTIKTGNGGGAEVGERNTVYFALANYMRYICDFNPSVLLAVLPDFGLAEAERLQAIHSAIGRPRKSEMPLVLQSAIATCERDRCVTRDGQPCGQNATDLTLTTAVRTICLNS